MARGQGFRSNNEVLENFVEKGQQQKALKYFGFKGTYDPNHKYFEDGSAAGATNSKTGEIIYHDRAFERNYDYLALIADHEAIHSRNILSGQHHGNLEEWSTYMANYQRQGFYTKHGVNLVWRIRSEGMKAGKYEFEMTPSGFNVTTFNPVWWHFIYKIPRLW